MVAFQGRGNVCAAAALSTVVAAAPCYADPADRDAVAGTAAEQRRLAQIIDDEESRNGPRSENLIDPLTGLGLLFQESGEHGLAVTAIDRALQVVRANYGLSALEQAPLLWQWIYNREAMGDFAAAWEREQELASLAHEHPDDLRTVPILREIAARRMTILERYLAGELPPQVRGCFYDETQAPGLCTSRTRTGAIRWMLSDVLRHYADAIGVLLRNGLYSSPELRELETELVRGIDLVRERNLLMVKRGVAGRVPRPLAIDYRAEPWRSRIEALARLTKWGDLPAPMKRHPPEEDERREEAKRSVRRDYVTGDYHGLGRLGLLRLVTYAAGTPSEHAAALVRLADWDLLYSHSLNASDSALELYRQAYRELQTSGASQAAIERIFAPAVPVVLPAFAPSPLRPDSAGRPAGHVDVAFDITAHGKSRRVEVLAATRNATNAVKKRLVRLIRSSRFRPRVTDGGFAAATRVVVRYALHGDAGLDGAPFAASEPE